MKRIAAALLLLATLAAARAPLGTTGRWSAFRDTGPLHCFAISEPVETVQGPRQRAFVSVATWPGAGQRGQLHVRLSRPRNPRAAVMLAVGERRFRLRAGGSDAFAPDAATDRAIVGAIRSGRSLSVESVGAGGGAFADVYALAGAPTAIDAAAVGCASA